MAVKVVDASALAAFLFGEPEAEEVLRRIDRATLAAPFLLPFEVASVCLKKIRRYPSMRSALIGSQSMLQRMELALMDVDLPEVIHLAEQKRLTVYDASYIWLALALSVDLITLDEKVARALAKRSSASAGRPGPDA